MVQVGETPTRKSWIEFWAPGVSQATVGAYRRNRWLGALPQISKRIKQSVGDKACHRRSSTSICYERRNPVHALMKE